jgi:hypothetical protein
MMRRTSAIVAVPLQADTRLSSIGLTWSTNVLGGMFLTLWIARLLLSHGPIVLRSPVNGANRHAKVCYVQRDVMRATGTQRVPPVPTTSSHAFSSKFGLSESKFGLKAFSWAT